MEFIELQDRHEKRVFLNIKAIAYFEQMDREHLWKAHLINGKEYEFHGANVEKILDAIQSAAPAPV